MKPCLVLLFLIFSHIAGARNFYINPSSDSTKELGTIGSPWKSLAVVNANMKMFKPGDSIFLKRGELYFERLKITCSGKENLPIVFATYGSAVARPTFLYKGEEIKEAILLSRCQYIIIDGFEITDDNLSPDEHDKTANISAAVNIDEAGFIILRKLKISLAGIGISITGNSNKVDSCNISNLKMIRNTVGGSDDYGANGIVMAGSDNIISNCVFENCWSNSFDYTYYGGVIQLSGTINNNIKIINNTAINCEGFMEIAGAADANFTNILVAHNSIINCGELVYVGSASRAASAVSNLLFLNNYIVNCVNRLPQPPPLISIRTATISKGIVSMQGNICWLSSGMDVAKQAQVGAGQLLHRNNVYYLAGGRLNFMEDASETLLNRESLFIRNLAKKYPKLNNIDLFPFIFILQSMDMFNL